MRRNWSCASEICLGEHLLAVRVGVASVGGSRSLVGPRTNFLRTEGTLITINRSFGLLVEGIGFGTARIGFSTTKVAPNGSTDALFCEKTHPQRLDTPPPTLSTPNEHHKPRSVGSLKRSCQESVLAALIPVWCHPQGPKCPAHKTNSPKPC